MNCLIKIIFPNFRSLYGGWTINKRMITIKTSEMWFYDECCVQHELTVSNKQVGHTSRNLLKVIVNRQIRFVGPVTRKKINWKPLHWPGWLYENELYRGGQRKTFTDWISTACGDEWNSNKILKICQDRNEHLLIANARVRHGTYIGSSDGYWNI